MQKRKMTRISCDYCSTEFEKPESEVIRNTRLNRKNYCSRICVGKDNIHKNIPKELRSSYPIQHHSSNRRDEYTGYREHLRRAKRRDENCNLDLLYLKEVFDTQQGKCVYSKVNLIHPSTSQTSFIYLASLDRIDSAKGYVKGNIQFISVAMNLMKSNMTNEEVEQIINIIKQS